MTLAVIFWVFTLANVWIGRTAGKRANQYLNVPQYGEQFRKMSASGYRGAAWTALVAVLCFSGRMLMAKKTRMHLLGGSLVITGALSVTIRTWAMTQLSTLNHLPWIEPVLVWPAMIYAIIYAYSESRHFSRSA